MNRIRILKDLVVPIVMIWNIIIFGRYHALEYYYEDDIILGRMQSFRRLLRGRREYMAESRTSCSIWKYLMMISNLSYIKNEQLGYKIRALYNEVIRIGQ